MALRVPIQMIPLIVELIFKKKKERKRDDLFKTEKKAEAGGFDMHFRMIVCPLQDYINGFKIKYLETSKPCLEPFLSFRSPKKIISG